LRNLYLSKNYYASIQNDNLLTKQICCQKSLVQREKLQKQQQKHLISCYIKKNNRKMLENFKNIQYLSTAISRDFG